MMKPLAQTELINSLQTKYSRQLVHGRWSVTCQDLPLPFGFATAEESEIEVIVSDSRTDAQPKHSVKVKSLAQEDFTAVAIVDGLHPNTEYQYSVHLDGRLCEGTTDLKFRTLSAKGEADRFVIAFGGGAGYVPENERMWDTIGSFDPNAILLLGDNVYIDDPESVVMQQYTYQRRQSRSEWRKPDRAVACICNLGRS